MKPELSKKWIMKSRKQYMLNKPLKQCHINIMFCSNHFERGMFANGSMDTLVSNAVPTIFEGNVNLANEEHANDHGYEDIIEPEVKIKVEESGDTLEVGEGEIEPPYRSGIAFVSYVRGERTGDGEVLKATKQAKVCQGMLS